ncbi:3-ketoacyl-CoA synthase 4 [Elaeis guineensis]|uniref:3-ketoacyl-CoA synthase n=1 Tax=Elaeis guineensis var. tenera TaxID=51953 RepID=A0A6I9RLP9_ELAGV|nr:3-ketoacyl-CoA synthase 11 [Elaeis guineensis]
MKSKTLLSLLTPIQLLQASFFLLLALTLTFHALLSSTPTLLLNQKLLLFLSTHRTLLFSLLWCTLVALIAYLSTRPHPVLLLDYACFQPDADRKCSYEVSEYFVRRSRRFSTTSEEFMRGIYLKSGLGDETYAPPFIFQYDYEAKLRSAVQEAEEGMIASVDAVLSKTHVPAAAIDLLIVTCGMFTPCPSLATVLVNHYRLPDTVATYNLSSMGCSSGAAAIDLAGRILSGARRVRYALVVITESISLNWYFGDNRSMLVTNCIFRVGTAAALLTNDGSRRGAAKMELLRALRTHHGADDASHRAAFQEEDEAGNLGIALKKDLIRVAGEGLRAHIGVLAPRVLPWAQLVRYAYWEVTRWLKRGGEKQHVPDFTTAFEHMCIHTGGKAVIEAVARLMRLDDRVTEPARMCLHRFGNTSSSLVLYELAYFEAKGRIRRGDRVWMLAFGTGFKVCSLVWKALKDSGMDPDNPWKDSIHRYPLKAW